MSKKNSETPKIYTAIIVPFEVFKQRIIDGWDPYDAAAVPHTPDEDVHADLEKMAEGTKKEGN